MRKFFQTVFKNMAEMLNRLNRNPFKVPGQVVQLHTHLLKPAAFAKPVRTNSSAAGFDEPVQVFLSTRLINLVCNK